MSDENNCQDEAGAAIQQAAETGDPPIALFIKAGSDKECVGCCPFSQRLFMILWLKGVIFNVTPIHQASKHPKELLDLAAGSHAPFLFMKQELLTDVTKCEDFIEAELYPPKYPKLACKYASSNKAGIDLFAKFSALIKKDKNDSQYETLYKRLHKELHKFNDYLETPLDDDIDADAEGEIKSTRKFIDGDKMTMADCNILPKLYIMEVALGEKFGYEIPAEFEGIHRYLHHAREAVEFRETCCDPIEILFAYNLVKPKGRR